MVKSSIELQKIVINKKYYTAMSITLFKIWHKNLQKTNTLNYKLYNLISTTNSSNFLR